MFKIHEIREMIKLIDQSSITHFELENEGDKLLIRKEQIQAEAPAKVYVEQHAQAAQVPVVETPITNKEAEVVAKAPERTGLIQEVKTEDDSKLHKILSPMVGTFYQAPSPDAKPYVSVGDKVDKNTVVCIVEAMKLMNEIEAEVRGTIVKVLVDNGQLVEYGQALFLVQPE